MHCPQTCLGGLDGNQCLESMGSCPRRTPLDGAHQRGDTAQGTDATCSWRCCHFLCWSCAWYSSCCEICPCPCAWRSVPQCCVFLAFPWLGVSTLTCPLTCWGWWSPGSGAKQSPRSCCWCSLPYQRTWMHPQVGGRTCVHSSSLLLADFLPCRWGCRSLVP